jgi:glycosyltransferase involved in cell wall biosynthesis
MDDSDDSRPVLFVPSTSEASGVATYVAALCAALQDLPTACLTEPGSDLDAALPESCERVPARATRSGMVKALRPGRLRYRFVQTHGARALLAARLAGLRGDRLGHMFHEPGDQQGLRGAVEWRLARGISVSANAPTTAGWVEQRLGRRAEVLTPIVNVPALLPREQARQELGLPAEADLVIGVIGRLSPVKRPELAVSAAARMAPRRPIVVFVGDGPERERLRRLGESLGVQVLLAGPRRAAASLLAALDVLAATSPYETFGLAIAEAMAAGTPVASVDSPGARLLGADSEVAQLAAPTAEGLAKSLSSALEESAQTLERRAESVLASFGVEASRARALAYFDRGGTRVPATATATHR